MLTRTYIDIQNQILGAVVAVTGTPFSLHYSSDRVRGRYAAYSLDIPLSMENIPAGLKEIRLEVHVSGQIFTKTFSPSPQQSYTFTWDGKDGSGHAITGKQQAKIRIGYFYKALFPRPAITRWTETTATVGTCGSTLGLNGWSLDVNHFYDTVGRVLYLGDGARLSDINVDPSVKISRHADDTETDIGEFVVAADDGSEFYIFDPAGRHHLRTVHGLTGVTLYRFKYDPSGRLAEIGNSCANITRIVRAAGGHPTEITAPYGQRTILTTTDNGHLESVTNAGAETIIFGYSKDGLIESLTDANSNTYRFSYDDSGRLIKKQDPNGSVTGVASKRSHDSSIVALITPLGREFTYLTEHLVTGEQQRLNKCCGGTEVKELLGFTNASTTTYPDGMVMKVMDLSGSSARIHVPLSASMTIATPGGLVEHIGIDLSAKLVDLGKSATGQNFNETININGRIYSTFYDAKARTFTNYTPTGKQSMMTIDQSGNIVNVEVPGLLAFKFVYDPAGRLVKIIHGSDWDNRATRFSYNNDAHLSTIVDSSGQAFAFGYDSQGRIITHTLPDGRIVRVTYDACGNITSLTPPGRSTHSFSYNSSNLISVYMPPPLEAGSKQTVYEYNADGQLHLVRRADGNVIQLSYGNSGRINKVKISRGEILYLHDPASGNLVSITSPDLIKVAYSYDGSLLTETGWSGTVSGTVGRVYDNNFRLMSLKVNDTTIRYQYDDDGLLTQAGELTLARNPETGFTMETSIGKSSDRWSYDAYGELNHYSALVSGAILYDVQYSRDKLGRIIEKRETNEGVITTFAYAYDLSGRLTEVKKNGTMAASYTYDLNSNRVTGSTNTVIYNYDAQDRLLTLNCKLGPCNYSYNDNGDLQSKTTHAGTTIYKYDELGNLMQVTLPSGTQIEYLIDGLNRRVGNRVNGILVRRFLYRDTLKPVAELASDNSILSYFVFGSRDNVPDYIVKNGTRYRVIADHLGSPRLVFDATSGAVAQRIDYDEFGNVERDTNIGFQPFGFAGGLYDSDTNLIRFGFRDYDPAIGRWTAKDPILFGGNDLNLYEYVRNDPVNITDPYGLGTKDGAGIVKKIADGTFRRTLTPEQRQMYDTIKRSLEWIHPIKHGVHEVAEWLLKQMKDWAKQNPHLRRPIECLEKQLREFETDPRNPINRMEDLLAKGIMQGFIWSGERIHEIEKWHDDRVTEIMKWYQKHSLGL